MVVGNQKNLLTPADCQSVSSTHPLKGTRRKFLLEIYNKSHSELGIYQYLFPSFDHKAVLLKDHIMATAQIL